MEREEREELVRRVTEARLEDFNRRIACPAEDWDSGRFQQLSDEAAKLGLQLSSDDDRPMLWKLEDESGNVETECWVVCGPLGAITFREKDGDVLYEANYTVPASAILAIWLRHRLYL